MTKPRSQEEQFRETMARYITRWDNYKLYTVAEVRLVSRKQTVNLISEHNSLFGSDCDTDFASMDYHLFHPNNGELTWNTDFC